MYNGILYVKYKLFIFNLCIQTQQYISCQAMFRNILIFEKKIQYLYLSTFESLILENMKLHYFLFYLLTCFEHVTIVGEGLKN